jgi:hypothetical protein
MGKHELKHFIVSKWPSSGLLVTVLSLIVFPSVVILSDYLYNPVLKQTLLKDTYYVGDHFELTILEYSIRFVQISIFIIILFFYPPYPTPLSMEDYFKERGYKSAVIEYEYVKLILYVAVPLFIGLTAIPYFDPLIQQYYSITFETYQGTTFVVAQTVLLFVVLAGILKLIFAVFRKKFRLYFAKGCFIIALEKKDETAKMSYFIKGLEAYNSYLRRNFDVQINDIKKFISKIWGLPLEERYNAVDEISTVFIKNPSEIYTLDPLRQLQKYLLYGRIEEDNSQYFSLEELLTQQPTINKIKDLSTFFAVTAIPLAISLVDLYQRFLQ